MKLEDFLPMSPLNGPPLPVFLNIFWPWYKKEEEVPPTPPPPPPPPTLTYSCPYCEESFATLEELIDHVTTTHPEMPPLGEIEIKWE